MGFLQKLWGSLNKALMHLDFLIINFDVLQGQVSIECCIFFTKSLRPDFVLYFLDNKNVVMDLT
jgi:hypothetical protein